jgi:hypothetical protein
MENQAAENKKIEHKQNWTIHLERMADEMTPKYILQYKPKGRCEQGGPSITSQYVKVSLTTFTTKLTCWRRSFIFNSNKSPT